MIAVRQGLQQEIIPIVRGRGFRLTEDYTVPWAPEDHPVDWSCHGVPVGKFTPLPAPFTDLIREDYSEIIRIGRYCSINGRACIRGNHARMISTNGYLFASLYSDVYNNSDDVKNRGVVIGNDVWLGANSFINSSRVHSIGDGAIIGAGAVVTHDVPPYAVMCGVPARIVKYRFTPEQIAILLRVRWWDQSDEWLCRHREYLVDMEKFFSRFKDAGLDG